MEPLTHAIIGLGLAALSGKPVTLSDPIYLASSLAAVIPDLDIIWQAKGDIAYLQHHRGGSHSIIGNMITALLVGGMLKLIFPHSLFWQLVIWAFVGAMSHSLFDICNSYGAQLFYPWSKKRTTLNLIQIFDPVIMGIFGLVLWSAGAGKPNSGIIALLPIYLGLRWIMRKHLYKRIGSIRWDGQIISVVLMPSTFGICKWDYLLETAEFKITGTISLQNRNILIHKQLEKRPLNSVTKKALESRIGEIFQRLTPYFHITHSMQGNRHVVCFLDLRYRIGQEFMHSATVVLDQGENLIEQIFHPYHKKRNIPVS